MDFIRLKNLVKKLGGLLVLDGEEPIFVMLSYDKYQKMEAGMEAGEEIPVSRGNLEESGAANGIDDDEAAVEKLNQEILALKEEIRQKEEAELIENGQTHEPIAETIDLD